MRYTAQTITRRLTDLVRAHMRVRPSYIGATAVGFLLLNGFWLLAAQWEFVFRPYFNYDYALAILLAPYAVSAAVVLSLLIYLQEIFISQSLIFHFEGIADFFRSGEFAEDVDLLQFLRLQDFVLFGLFAALSYGVARFLKARTNGIAAVIVVLLAFAADQINGSSYLIESDHQLISGNIGGSSSLNIFESLRQSAQPAEPPQRIDDGELPVSKDRVLEWVERNPDRSVLFVIVESWGVNDTDALNRWIANRVRTPGIEAAYDTTYGEARFSGATTAAELRHLCGLKGSYSSVLSSEVTRDCIPRALQRQGYRTIGAHGFSKSMFRRNRWWPRIGLEERWFADHFASMDAPYCGSGMYGVCDTFIVDRIGERMSEQPGFYYHLTLNTHLPVVDTEIDAELDRICSRNDVPDEVCALSAKLGQYLVHMESMLRGRREKPFVFIVGDHAPPFASQANRTFSNGHTPYLVLEPRD